VAAILYGITGRLQPRGWWWKYGRVQWVISLGLMPLSLLLFQQASLISLLANLIAVPAVGFLVLPLCLSGTLLLLFYQPLGHWLLLGSAKIIGWIWQLLAWFSQVHGAIWQQGMPNGWVLAATVIGIALLLGPRGLPGRYFGLLWLCPIIFYQSPAPKMGEIRFTLLDVGQGLATVVQTAKHSLVFDTGPPMGAFDDAGQRVILPFLRSSGITRIDQLMISHGDSDHMGGAESLLRNISVAEILTSVPERFAPSLAQVCRAGQRWQWDGVDFQVLYPTLELLHQNNNSSCVLRIQSGKTVLLLTGDIEKSAEEFLVETKASLAADILVAPHHGSKTSSTTNFVRSVNPRYVLFPVGYKNRYHFPSQMVVKRYEKLNSILLNTANSGAITVNIKAKGKIEVKQYRQEKMRVWY
jgi:competence protein ComEC